MATVLFICISSINNKSFNQQRPPLTEGGLPVLSINVHIFVVDKSHKTAGFCCHHFKFFLPGM